jgi:hypothetical protein
MLARQHSRNFAELRVGTTMKKLAIAHAIIQPSMLQLKEVGFFYEIYTFYSFSSFSFLFAWDGLCFISPFHYLFTFICFHHVKLLDGSGDTRNHVGRGF